MTPEQLRQNADAMLAAAEGRPVQYKGLLANHAPYDWLDICDPNFVFDTIQYRRKPEPKTRPWSMPGDVPAPICWMKHETRNAMAFVTSIDECGIRTVFCHSSWSEIAAEKWSYSTDRLTWQPCTVSEP